MRKTTNLILCALFAALIAVGAFIRVPIPPVPVTVQTLFVLLGGMLLGGKYGALSCLLYLAIGLCGLPVFAKGGGLSYLLEPTFGYLAGFVFCAFIVGMVTEHVKNITFFKLFAAGLLGLLVTYAVGVLHLYLVKSLYLAEGGSLFSFLTVGMTIFLPTDIISCAVSAGIAKRVRPILKARM